ncbi:neurobeachin-like protein, partial [Trifolium medium]|nr:neurobeachin-like protein [Trifolium medium]
MEDVWTMKKQLPDFVGTDPVGWITATERFFEMNEVPSRDKLQWAFMSMEDEQAMMWFYYWCEENPNADWNSFSIAMIREFGAQMVQNQESE